MKSDLFSFSIILWELITRTIKGDYTMPYAECNYKIDFQVIIGSAKKGKRPAIDSNTPPSLIKLLESCWSRQPSDRPSGEELKEKLSQIQEEYLENKEVWDALLPLSARSNLESIKAGSWAHSTTAPASSANSPAISSSPSASAVISSDKKKPALKRSLSGKMLNVLRKEERDDKKAAVETKKPSITIGTPQWTHRGADDLLNDQKVLNSSVSEPSVSGDEWRKEDSFDDEKKKKKGLFSIFKKK